MIVEKIVAKNLNATITVDGCEHPVLLESVYAMRINVGDQISKNDLDALIESSDYLTCKNYLFTQIEKYSKTEKGYRDKLFDKGFSAKSIAQAMDYAKSRGYINDKLFVERYYQNNRSKKGIKRIKYELIQKGVKSENLAILESYENDENAIKNICEKFIKNREKTQKNKDALIRRLLTKGFNFSDFMSYVNEIFAEID